jgi:organic radical activating enzyme
MQAQAAPLIPLPPQVQDALRVNWHLTLWCNYSCQYCPVLVFHQRSAAGEPREHSFDHYPVERWLEALRRFPQRRIHLKMTGGEPFLDRKNFRELLCGLAEMKHIRVGIDTNGYWDATHYEGFDKSGIFLNVSYHPSQCGFPEFLKRLRAIRDGGFTVAMVNYIVAPENMDVLEAAFAQLEAEGFCVNASTMIQTGVYLSRTERTDRELDLLVRYNTPIDLEFKLLQPETKGRMCFYPAMTYYIRFDGKIRVGCMDEYQDLFTDGIPPLPQGAVPCPQQQCENCTDMYRALIDEPLYPKPVQLYTLEDYAREFSEYRREQQVDDPEFRKQAVAYWYGRVDEKRRLAEAALPPIRIEAAAAEVPETPIFGYVDARDGKFFIEARSRDRVWVSGWVVSPRLGAPVREVALRVDGQQIAVIRDFHPRPDVAAHFGRANFLQCGWQALAYLPALKPGEHELIVEATDAEGATGTLAPWRVKIAE